MGRWSRDELNRTIDEVKRRSLVDPQFRVLALSQPLAAIGKINPKTLPPHLLVRFVDASTGAIPSADSDPGIVIVLPDFVAQAEELSDDELERAAGGKTDIKLPIE